MPKWIKVHFDFRAMLKHLREFAGKWIRHRAVWYSLAGILLLCAILLIWSKLPKPVTISVNLAPPALTSMEPDSQPYPLRISFGDSVAKLAEAGKPVSVGVKIEPMIAGSWRWESDRDLVFAPAVDWNVGENYRVVLNPKLFREKTRLASYQLSFQTTRFSMLSQSGEFYIDPQNPSVKRVVMTLEFSHPVDPVSLEKNVRFEFRAEKGFRLFGGKKTDFTVSYNKTYSRAFLQTTPLPIPDKSATMDLNVGKSIRSTRGGNSLGQETTVAVTVPGLYNYCSVNSTSLQAVRNNNYELERVLMVEMSADAKPEKIVPHVNAYLLPVAKPAEPGSEGQENYGWDNTAQISPLILKQSEKIVLTALPIPEDFGKVFSFKLNAPPERYVYVVIDKDLESLGGYKSPHPYDAIHRVEPFEREIKILYDGAILSMSGDHQLSILAHGEEAARCQVSRVLPNQIQHLISQTEGNFQNPQFQNYRFNQDNISSRTEHVLKLKKLEPGKVQYFSYDFTPQLSSDGYGLFFFKVEGYDPGSKNTTGTSDWRLILITDLGVLAKENNDGSQDFFVQSIGGGTPVSGAVVEVLSRNGQVLLQRTTDDNGHTTFPTLGHFTREKEPVAFVVKRGVDFSFLPYKRSDRRLNFSRFDIGGLYGASEPEKLRAYVFSDRGIYRPGEEIQAAWIVKAGDWQRSLKGIPIEVAITDPRELEIYRKRISLSPEGYETIAYGTESTSLTGTYQINVYLITHENYRTLLGSEAVRVEEFIPDRMKIDLRFSRASDKGWVAPKDLKALVNLKNLYGIPAEGRRVAAQLNLMPGDISLPGYKEYQFFDPYRAKKTFQQNLEDQTTTKSGDVEFELGLEQYDRATYRLMVVAEGYEPDSGRGVSATKSILVSPLNYLLGYKANGKLDYIAQGSARKISLVALNPEVKPIAVKGIRAQLVEIRYVSVLMQQENGTYKYQSVPKRHPATEWKLDLSTQGMEYDVPSETPGDYELVLNNAQDEELCKIPFTVVGSGNMSRSLDKNAELTIRLDKPDYVAGEPAKVFIQAPYSGAGLITIERDKVYAYKWFKTETNASVQTIVVPESLEGNGYINVAFIRAADSREIYMSPLSYGVAPFFVAKDRRMNPITLDLPEDTESGKSLKIRYKSEYAGKIIVYAVDEGILQVAHYKTPDPLSFFFQKRALEVSTDQILDQILPEFRLVQDLSSTGGGEGADEIGKNLNPFKRKQLKPAVYWSGLQTTDENWHTLEYTVPSHFNGTLRVMAVAVTADRIGVAKQEILARNHFILSPNVPLFVSPGDEFSASCSIANNLKGSGKAAAVQVRVATTDQLKIVGNQAQIVNVDEGSEQTLVFRFKALSNPGGAEITFTAAKGEKKSLYSAYLSVRPAVPYRVTSQSGMLRSGKVEAKIDRKMFPAFRTLEAVVSNLPAGLSTGLVKYLNEYPYICTEQLVSRGFAALFLKKIPELDRDPQKSSEMVEQTQRVLNARQNAEGSFGIWAANFHADPFHAVYALHFLTEAREQGLVAGSDAMLKRGLEYLKEYLHSEKDDYQEMRNQAYAGYILTRNGMVVTNDLQALQERLKEYPGWKQDLTAVYLGAAYKIMLMDKAAESLVVGTGFLKANAKKYKHNDRDFESYYDYYDDAIREAQYLYIIAKHFPDWLPKVSGEGIEQLAEQVQQGYCSTLSSAYVLLAFASLSDLTSKALPEVKVLELRPPKEWVSLALERKVFPRIEFSDKASSLRFMNEGSQTIFYQVVTAGFDYTLPVKPVNNQLEVYREYRAASGNNMQTAEVGEEIEVHIRLRALDQEYVSNVAVVDLFPGGFEPVLNASRNQERFTQEESEGEVQRWIPIGSLDSTWQPDFFDIREDRVVLHGSVSKKAQDFVYRLKAVNPGIFNQPPIFAEAMYNRRIWSQNVGGKFQVKKAGEK